MVDTTHVSSPAESPCVSILIPVYNVERYLRQCLDSVAAQTLSGIEIICLNDGSTDSSAAILEEYAAQDRRIRVITHENYGYGYTLNRGISEATGTYIGIVESDDWVDPAMFETLYNAARDADADMAKCNFYKEWTRNQNRRELYTYFDENQDGEVICPRQDPKATLFRKKPAVWSAIYRRSFLDENQIRFLETPGASYQDTSFSFKALWLAERLVCVTAPFVHYRQDNEASSINSTAKAYCVCDEYEEIERFLTNLPESAPEGMRILAPLVYDTFMWNYDRLDPSLKPAFLEMASYWFRRLLSENKVDWSGFTEHKRTNFRMIAYKPAAYQAWRRKQDADRTTHEKGNLISMIKKWIRAIVPPSRTNFSNRMRAFTRQLDTQQATLDELIRQVDTLTQLVQANLTSEEDKAQPVSVSML